MKKFKITVLSLILLSLVITALMLQFMPDTVPAHYNAAGEIDRLGSKYESFLFPAATAVMGAFFLLMDKWLQTRSDMKAAERKVFYIIAVATVVFFVGMGVYFMAQSIAYGAGNDVSVPGFSSALFNTVSILMGTLHIILGAFMPNARVNYLFGIRTTWSMANETVWKESQRFGGVSSVLCGSVLIILGIFVTEYTLWWMLGILALWSIITIAASYVFYRKARAQS